MRPQEVILRHDIQNIKEIRSFRLLEHEAKIPQDIFNMICNDVVDEMRNFEKMNVSVLRDVLYNILIYQLDIADCVWYVLEAFLSNSHWWRRQRRPGGSAPLVEAEDRKISNVVEATFFFFKYYNNNYRPIYHIEAFFIELLRQLYDLAPPTPV